MGFPPHPRGPWQAPEARERRLAALLRARPGLGLLLRPATPPGRSGRAREGPGPEALEVGGAMWRRDPESLELGRNRPHPSTPLGSVQSLARLLTPGRPYRPFQEHLSEGHLRASYRAILNLADSANCCMMVLHTECMLISPLHCHHIPIIWRATGQECPSLERKPSFFAKPGHSLPLGSATEVVQPLISQCPQNTLTEGTDTFQALYKIPRKPMEAFWHELKKHLPSPPSWRSDLPMDRQGTLFYQEDSRE
ncbi:uncharacterized protein LOC105099334 isoform X2 [Camelus dromedarius]|uniref:uncharacterized protein LOC105099334 isoform X2 n=1 Tax=Camelus dromedarius TaxID=9838 RepID=UPI0031197384